MKDLPTIPNLAMTNHLQASLSLVSNELRGGEVKVTAFDIN